MMVLFVVLGVSLFMVVSERSSIMKIIDDKAAARIEVARHLTGVCREAVIGNDQLLIINTVKNIKNNNDEILEIIYVDRDGKVMASTDAMFIGKIDVKLSSMIIRPDAYVALSPPENKDIWSIFMPVIIGSERAGTVKIVFSQIELNRMVEEARNMTYQRILGISSVSLLLGIFGSIILAAMMSQPIKKLSKAAHQIGEGNLDTEIKVRRKDELGALAGEFNSMAKKLKQLDEMKDAFMSNVTHDLKSPLGAMKGYIDFLLKGRMGTINERQKEALVRISENASRLSSFIGDILDYARIKSGGVQVVKEEIDMAGLIRETVDLITPMAEEKEITLSAEVPAGTVKIYADLKNIERVLHNLISNAIKFTPEKGRITVGLEEKKKEIVARVSDSGIGIPAEEINSIFEKFHQVSEHVKSAKTKGVGLGLAIVKGIVESHGGRVWVESRVNKGSTFYFSVPKGAPENTA